MASPGCTPIKCWPEAAEAPSNPATASSTHPADLTPALQAPLSSLQACLPQPQPHMASEAQADTLRTSAASPTDSLVGGLFYRRGSALAWVQATRLLRCMNGLAHIAHESRLYRLQTHTDWTHLALAKQTPLCQMPLLTQQGSMSRKVIPAAQQAQSLLHGPYSRPQVMIVPPSLHFMPEGSHVYLAGS